MNFDRFRQTWTATKGENNFFRWISGALVIVIILLAGFVTTRDQIVVLTPPAIPEKMEIGKKHASSGFKKSWALFVATLVGNVDPSNADFIVDQLSGMMSPEILLTFKAALAEQLEVIRRDQISISFEGNQIYFEKETGKTFVIGKSSIAGSGGRSNKQQRVFELEMDIQNYSPVITFIDTYEGDPHTLAWKEKQARRDERQKSRDEKQSKQ